jgi:hypothetical protein
MLASLAGSYLPFPRSEAQRKATGDPRVSILQRYGSFEGYQKQWERAREDLLARRYLLKEDAERLRNQLDDAKKVFSAAPINEPGTK